MLLLFFIWARQFNQASPLVWFASALIGLKLRMDYLHLDLRLPAADVFFNPRPTNLLHAVCGVWEFATAVTANSPFDSGSAELCLLRVSKSHQGHAWPCVFG
jgi:hypothetical protein